MPRTSLSILIAALLIASPGAIQQPTATWTAETLDGHSVAPLIDSGQRATVLLFVSVDCPISNKYAPAIQRLHEQYSEKGIRFWLVYSPDGASPEEIQKHVRDFKLPPNAAIDTRKRLTKAANAEVTPEAALFDPEGNLLYRGRIDDRFVSFGVERSAPTTHDLSDAIESLLAGRPIAPSETKAVGCRISH